MPAIPSTADIVRVHARERGDRLALVDGDVRLTWRELDDRSNRVAHALAAHGIGHDDRVAFLDKNGRAYFEVYFGTAKIRAVAANVNWRLAAPEVAWIVNHSGARIFFFGAEYADLVAEIRDRLPTVERLVCLDPDDRFDSYEEWLSDDASDTGIAPAPDDVAFQLYSSGTTGLPKGVMLSHANVMALTPRASTDWGFTPDMVSLVALPLFHVGGSLWAIVGMFNGAASVILREPDPLGVIEAVEAHRVTHTFMVPALLQFMLLSPTAATADFASLELVVYGASPISEETLAASIDAFGCRFLQVYGLTESCGPIAHLAPEDHVVQGAHRHRLRSCGRPNVNAEIRVLDVDTGAVLGPGDVGEIVVRTDQNMLGYWRDPEGTASAFADGGWLRTGDVGYFDDDGYLYIHDRIKDMIVSGGENIYPAEVENALMKHPDIADVAVIGVPDDRWGESGLAIVVPVEGARPEPEEIIAFARGLLAGFKIPRAVTFADSIPRNPTGKILKKDLRAPFWEGRGRQVN